MAGLCLLALPCPFLAWHRNEIPLHDAQSDPLLPGRHLRLQAQVAAAGFAALVAPGALPGAAACAGGLLALYVRAALLPGLAASLCRHACGVPDN